MNKILKIISLILVASMLICAVSCGDNGDEDREIKGYILAGASTTDVYKTGLSMVFKLSDGALLVYDGGTASVSDFLLSSLKEISGKDTVDIAAWIVTHDHDDHYGALDKLISDGKTEGLNVKEFWTNPVNDEGKAVYEGIKKAFPNATLKRLTYGEDITLDRLKLRVLCTPEVIPDDPRNDVNTNSLVLMVDVDGEKILLAADANEPAWDFLVAQHKKDAKYSLECDFLQVPHHGIFDAGTAEGYALANPSALLIPAGLVVSHTTTTPELAKPTYDLYKKFKIEPQSVSVETDGVSYWFAGEYGDSNTEDVKCFFTLKNNK